MENNSFLVFDNRLAGMLYDDSEHPKYPIRYYNVINGAGLTPQTDRSYFVYVYEGATAVAVGDRPHIPMIKGMYFTAKGDFCFHGDCFRAIAIEVFKDNGDYPNTDYRAFFSLGGPLEKKGRLKYIDGCSDSLLIPPVKLGDPCLNHLHFPPEINQTQHTHPTHRIGIVTDGHGKCITPFGSVDLTEGTIFIIKAWDGKTYKVGSETPDMYPIGQHAFQTFYSSMDVVAFHPDSDFGPTDLNHPMINRTIVDGVSANSITDIQTK